MSKRSVEKRVRAKREAERAARRRQERIRKIRIWAGSIGAVALIIILFFVFKPGGGTRPAAQPTIPTPTASGTPSVNPGCGTTKPDAYRGKQYPKPTAYRVNPKKKYTATVETSCGQMIIELLPKSAPETVSNFVYLSRQAFFDGLTFHRVIPGFMIQGGDPKGDGTGGPGYKFKDEIDRSLVFDKAGLLAMANSGPNTNGSQFFITDGPATHLNGKHTIFGRLLSGQETVTKIVSVPRGPNDRPFVPVYILKVTITET